MTISEAIRKILNEVGHSVLRDPRRFRALLRDCCHDAHKGELHITCVLLAENHVERLRVNSLVPAERERIQNLLHQNYGFDARVVSVAISNWWNALRTEATRAQIQLDTTEPEIVAETALTLNAQGRHNDAEVLLRQALSLHPLSAALHATLAEILALQERLGDAIKYIKKARELDSANVDYVVFEGRLSLQNRNNQTYKTL